MTQKVVDSNFPRSEKLREYLSRNKQNFVVIPDYTSMEAYSGDALRTICESMAILSSFPKQVLILKGTQTICGLSPRPKGLQRRMIKERETEEFPQYCEQLRLAVLRDERLRKIILKKGEFAREDLDKLIPHGAAFTSVLKDLANYYSKDERKLIREGGAFSEELKDKFVRNSMALAGQGFANHPKVSSFPKLDFLTNRYIFRVAMATHLLVMDWLAHGGGPDANPIRIKNDMVDVLILSYASYFDGLLSHDAKAQRIHNRLRSLLLEIEPMFWPKRKTASEL